MSLCRPPCWDSVSACNPYLLGQQCYTSNRARSRHVCVEPDLDCLAATGPWRRQRVASRVGECGWEAGGAMTGNKGRPRPRWNRRGLAISTAGALVAAGIAAIRAWPHLWPWLAALTAGSAALIPLLISSLIKTRESRANTAQVIRGQLQHTTGTAGENLPTVSGIDLTTHIHQR